MHWHSPTSAQMQSTHGAHMIRTHHPYIYQIITDDTYIYISK